MKTDPSVAIGHWVLDLAQFPHADYVQELRPDHTRPSEAVGRYLKEGEASAFELEYRLAIAGREFWVQTRGPARQTETGIAISLPGVVTDITRQREALADRARAQEEALRQARVFDTTLAAIPDFVYVLDRNGRFLYANKALLNLWDLKLEAVVGKDFFDLQVPPSLAARLHRQIQFVIDNAQSVSDETPYESPTGVRGVYEYIFSPVFAPDGSVEAVAGATRNITARKRVEEDLRRRNAQFESLLNQTPLGVYLVDADLRICDANPIACTLFADSPGLIGSDFVQVTHRLWPAKYADEWVARLRHTLETGEVSILSDLYDPSLGQEGTYRYKGTVHRMMSGDGRPGVVCYFRGQPADSSAA
jgi:PAS domain S-box-containing protein